MKILTDLQSVVSALTHIVVTTTNKSDQIISNVMDVGVAATGEWKSDAEHDALVAQDVRNDAREAYKAAKAAKQAKKQTK